MARKEYTEDILVQEPTARLMQEELGWRSLFAFNEESYGDESLLGRRNQSETVLARDLHAAIRRINPDLPEAAYEEALKTALSEDASKTLLQINEAKYKLLRDGILLKRVKHADGRVSDEVEEFRKWRSDVDPEKSLDITPHRKKMVDRELGVEFKKSDNPFRVAIVCAMWLTGFDVKSLSTLYLDKPMKGHALRDDGEAIAEYGEAIHAVVEFVAALGFELQPLIEQEEIAIKS